MDGRVYRYPVPRGTTTLPPTTSAELDIKNRLDAAFASQNMATVDSLLATVQGINDWSPVLLYYRGFRRLSNQDPAAALDDFNQLLALQSGVLDAYFFRGLAYQNLGRHSAAIQDFTVVMNNKSARAPFAQANRGVSYLALGDTIRARADLEAAVKAGVTDAQKYIDQYLK
jgi:Tfp pilus assembly protein PilF